MKNTSVGTAAASSGVAGAITVIACWGLSLAHVDVPDAVAASFLVVIAAVLHILVVRFGAPADLDPPPPAPAQAAPQAPIFAPIIPTKVSTNPVPPKPAAVPDPNPPFPFPPPQQIGQ